jgi:hypothetical protein
MSDLRDIVNTLRTFDKRFTSIEQCLVILVRDSTQQSEWRHEQRNRSSIEDGIRQESELAMKQAQETLGILSHRLDAIVERLDNAASIRLSDVKELRDRTRQLEIRLLNADDEVTKA